MKTALPVAALAAAILVPTTAPAQAAPALPPMVFTSDRDGDGEIYLRGTDGRLTQLTANRSHDDSATWSPDGRRIAFVSTRDGDADIYVMNADGTGVRQLTRNSRTSSGMPIHDTVPAWSPDGTLLAFASNRDGGEAEIYRMKADGSSQVRLTRTAAHVTNHTPSWSPGGGYIVFNSDRVSYDNVEIYRMRANGTEVTRLTRTASGIDDNTPKYSPDGRRILFSSTRSGGQHDLFTMSSDGTGVKRLTGDSALDDVFARWAADGKQVVFHTFAGPEGKPSEDVWAVNSDGTERRRVVATAAGESAPDARPRVR
jgi:TolB protein